MDPTPTGPTYGLGGIQSPPDIRDWDIGTLYATTAAEPLATAPAAYVAPSPYPGILNQGDTPKCVAFSNELLKAYEDLRDTGPANFDEDRFFIDIGGTPAGAVGRLGLAWMLNHGYPIVGNPAAESLHKIAAYYAVPVSQAAIQSAIVAFGPLLIGLPWYASWFEPLGNGALPAPDHLVGNHFIAAIGWDSRGLRLRNSWGAAFGISGECYLPWPYLGRVFEAWKAVDVINKPVPPPKPRKYGIHIAPHALVRSATLKGTCISGWTDRVWGATASGAPCVAPIIRKGCSSGQATIAKVTAGVFAGHWVRIGGSVTLYDR